MKRVADLLVDTLVAAGVERVYGLNPPRDNIQSVPVRHEETAAFAAGAEAHLTGRLAVCAGSWGPGNLHLINASRRDGLKLRDSFNLRPAGRAK